jgi:hypothetical protein
MTFLCTVDGFFSALDAVGFAPFCILKNPLGQGHFSDGFIVYIESPIDGSPPPSTCPFAGKACLLTRVSTDCAKISQKGHE